MDRLPMMPLLWAQTAPDGFEMPLLALRRWFWGQTLASPRPAPGSEGLGAWLLGLLALLVAAMVAQGPGRALGQLLDLPGHVRLIAAAADRLRASARLVMVVLGAAVASWTGALLARYNRPTGLADLALLTRTRSVPEVAVEQGILAAMTPLRDLFSLADLLVLLAIAIFVTFRFSADRWGLGDEEPSGKPLPTWGTVAWCSATLYGLYRLVAMFAPTGDLPPGGMLFVEAPAVPALMLVSDGLLAAWILVELRRAERSSVEPIPMASALALLPAAMLACLLAMPARYAATAAYLALPYAPGVVAQSVLAPLLRGWGLVYLQGAALVGVGLAGAVPWCRGGWGEALAGYGGLLRREGGHLVAVLAIGGLAAGVPAGLAYLLVLSLPAQPWVLPAADSYAHYGTIVVGLGLLAALVELGHRAATVPETAREPAGSGAAEAVR